MTGRVTRPAELPRQRGHRTSVLGSNQDGRETDRVLARPAGRPPGPSAPRSARRAPRHFDWSDIADSWFGFLVVVVTVAATVVAIGVVVAAVMGF